MYALRSIKQSENERTNTTQSRKVGNEGKHKYVI